MANLAIGTSATAKPFFGNNFIYIHNIPKLSSALVSVSAALSSVGFEEIFMVFSRKLEVLNHFDVFFDFKPKGFVTK